MYIIDILTTNFILNDADESLATVFWDYSRNNVFMCKILSNTSILSYDGFLNFAYVANSFSFKSRWVFLEV